MLAIFSAPQRRGSPASWLLQKRDVVRVRAVRYRYGAGLRPVARCLLGLTATDCRNPHAAPRLPSPALPPVGASLLAIFSAPQRRGSPASWLLQKRDVVRIRAVRYSYGAGLRPVARCLLGLTATDCRNPHAAPRLPSLALSPVGASLLAIFSAPRRRGSPATWLLQQRDPRLVHVVRVRAVRYRYGASLPPVARCLLGLTATDCRNPHAAPRLPSLALSPVGASLLAIFSAPRRRGSPATWLLQQRDPRLVHVVRVRAVRYRYGASLPPVARCLLGLTATDCRNPHAAPRLPSLALSPVGASLLAIFSAPQRRGSPATWLLQQPDPRLVHVVPVRTVRCRSATGRQILFRPDIDRLQA